MREVMFGVGTGVMPSVSLLVEKSNGLDMEETKINQ